MQHILEHFGHICGTINLNRRSTRCITTSFYRRHNSLWEDETRWIEFPGSEVTTQSIPVCCPVEGRHRMLLPLLLELNGTWCAFPRVASGSCCIIGRFSDERTTLLTDFTPSLGTSFLVFYFFEILMADKKENVIVFVPFNTVTSSFRSQIGI